MRAAHPYSLASLVKRPGGAYATFGTSPRSALISFEFEYANARSSLSVLVLDCDEPVA